MRGRNSETGLVVFWVKFTQRGYCHSIPELYRFLKRQYINLLNEARENLESLIDDICFRFHYYKPRMYCQNARKDYLSLAKCRKRTAKKIRKAIKKQLQYANRALGYIELFLSQDDVSLKPKQMERIHVIRELVEQ